MNSIAIRIAALVMFVQVQPAVADQPSITAERVKTAIAELDKFIPQTMQGTGVPGIAVAVVFQDKVVLLKGYGVRQIGKPDLIDQDTVFQLASVSKPIATTVLAKLVENGTIRWDDRILDHDPSFRLFDPWATRELTFRDALCHRSGLPKHSGDLLEDLGYDRSEIMWRLRFLKPSSSFRSEHAYTNFVFTEAGIAAARSAGKPWEELSAELLYRPLHMKSTSSLFANFQSAKNRAVGHVRADGKFVAKYVRQPDAQSPAGGASSTVSDMTQWLRLQLAAGKCDGKQIIAAEALGDTHRPQIVLQPAKNPDTERTGFYGLGWNVSYDDAGRVRLSHSGGFDLGAATNVSIIPSEQLGIIVLTNAAPIGVAEAIPFAFFDLVFQGKIERDWVKLFGQVFQSMAEPGTDFSRPPQPAKPALPNSAYVGQYGNDYFGPIEVVEKDGALQLRMGPKKVNHTMRHFDRDTFTYQPTGEMAGGLSGVTFRIGVGGKAATVVIENLDVHGQGTFTRAGAK